MEEQITVNSQPVEQADGTTLENAPAQSLFAETAVEESIYADKTAEENEDGQELTKTEKKKYAGKYESPEELEKGYTSQSRYVGELREKVKTLEEEISQRSNEENDMRQAQARAEGFNSAEEAEIVRQVKLAEFEHYAGCLESVEPEQRHLAAGLLKNYYETADESYLNEAKKYFSGGIIEQAALLKRDYASELLNASAMEKNAAAQESLKRLADEIESAHGEFLGDLESNNAKSGVISAMFDIGAITSVQDMGVLAALYSAIEEQAVERYIAGSEAEKSLEIVKNRAAVPSGAGQIPVFSGRSKDINSRDYWQKYYETR